jgi:hypothetical protein
MKLALIYDPECPKLSPKAYSHTYRDMFLALIERFGEVQHISSDCGGSDIDADVIIFYDIHSSHHIEIEGIEKHPAIKYEYFNDPHQPEFSGVYPSGLRVHKLSAEQRTKRALLRGVNYIICPYPSGYYKSIAPHLGNRADDMFVWFPVAPRQRKIDRLPLVGRKHLVLGNGHLWHGHEGFRPYEFRNWAYRRKCVTFVPHTLHENSIPKGNSYQTFLGVFAGALALSEAYPVPKYFEIPLAGCLSFVQDNPDFPPLGMKDGEHCIMVTEKNFDSAVNDFKNNVKDYQCIADAGRKLIEDNWTADKFADFIYQHALEHK